jgi:hypothetical protein
MVKATLSIKNGVEIEKCTKLKQGEGYGQIEVLLNDAPDYKYLMMKVSLQP